MVDGVQSCSAMAQGGRKFNTFKTLVSLPIFLFFFFALSFFHPSFLFLSRHREGGKDRMANGRKGDRQL
jgi:hypothetical protein